MATLLPLHRLQADAARTHTHRHTHTHLSLVNVCLYSCFRYVSFVMILPGAAVAALWVAREVGVLRRAVGFGVLDLSLGGFVGVFLRIHTCKQRNK